jgi:2-oxoglutarate dehydrogenase E2 component (dihydrolipoamide succinyltransferase)
VPVTIVVPELGESIREARVARWLKREGEAVSAGEPVVELETEKVNVEVGTERSGVLSKIERREGQDVRSGDTLGVIEERPAGAQAVPQPEVASRAQPGPQASAVPAATLAAPTPSGDTATPLARRLAEEHGIDVAAVPGTGPHGRITREDVERYLEHAAVHERPAEGTRGAPPHPQGPSQPELAEARAAPAAPAGATRSTPTPPAGTEQAPSPEPAAAPMEHMEQAPPREPTAPAVRRDHREERVRLSTRRLTIARRLLEAQRTAAMLTTFNEVDMGAITDLRERRRAAAQQRHGVSPGIVAFFVRATVAALRAFPSLNAELQGDQLILKHYYDLGIAIGADEGLVVPVVRDADRLSIIEIEQAIQGYVRKVEQRALGLDDLRGGTFTITNGGVFGSLLSTPILNPPQVGILGLHRIVERPVARDREVVIRPMMYVALTYDHRVVDGREAVSFLVRVKELIEQPDALLMEG